MKRIIIVMLLAIIMSVIPGCNINGVSSKKPDLSQIRSICNLATLECYYHNVAKTKKEAGSGISHIGETDRTFWIEYTGIAKIGIDMSKVNMQIDGDTVSIFIPNAKLLSIDISEDNMNYISNDDSWFNKNKITAEDQISAINDAQSNMAESVKNNSALLLSAQSRAKDLIENYIIKLNELSKTEYKIEWQYESNQNSKK